MCCILPNLFLFFFKLSNHFTRKSYYDEMINTVPGFTEENFMEVPMMRVASSDCTKWGTWLYGKPGHGPMLKHLDGKHTINLTKQNVVDRWWANQQGMDVGSSQDIELKVTD